MGRKTWDWLWRYSKIYSLHRCKACAGKNTALDRVSDPDLAAECEVVILFWYRLLCKIGTGMSSDSPGLCWVPRIGVPPCRQVRERRKERGLGRHCGGQPPRQKKLLIPSLPSPDVWLPPLLLRSTFKSLSGIGKTRVREMVEGTEITLLGPQRSVSRPQLPCHILKGFSTQQFKVVGGTGLASHLRSLSLARTPPPACHPQTHFCLGTELLHAVL